MLQRIKSAIGVLFRNNENPNHPISDDDSVGLYGGYSPAGIHVSAKHALTLSPFWQGVDILAGDVAKIPLELFEKQKDGTNQPVPENPIYALIRNQPNDEQPAYEFWEQMMTCALVFRNAYALIVRNQNTGIAEQLIPLLPDRTEPAKDKIGRFYRTEIDNKLAYFDASDVLHVKGISLDGQEGLKVWQYLKASIGLALARRNFQSRFFRFGGRVGGVLQIKGDATQSRGRGGPGAGTSPDKTTADQVERNFRSMYEHPDKAFQVIALRQNAAFHAAQASFRDTQILEATEADVRECARWLNIPPHKLGDKTAANYNTLEQENRAYYDSSLSHWCRRIAAQCYIKLLSPEQRRSGRLFFEHKIASIHWADSKTVASVATQGVRGGWLLANEARHWFNLPPVAGGDQLLVPSGMVPAGQEQSRAIEQLITNTRARFVKRLGVAAHKAVKTDAVNQFLEDIKRSHLDVGREMFEPAMQVQHAFCGKRRDIALELVSSWCERIEAARETSNESLEQIIRELESAA